MGASVLFTTIVIVVTVVGLIGFDVWSTLQNPYYTLSHVWLSWTDRWPVLIWAWFGLGAHLCLPKAMTLAEQLGYGRLDGVMILVWATWLVLLLSLSGVAQNLSPWFWALTGTLVWWLLWPQSPIVS